MRAFGRLSRRAEILLDALLLFLLTAVLIRPLFKARYLAVWGSIESTFIADARYLMAHWPHPQWQPLWYTGTRFDYIYPPALRYGTALLARLIGYVPAKAYHVYTALFYCAGIAGVYLLARVGMKSRGAAWLAAVAAALLSPSYLLLPKYREASSFGEPVRLWALVQDGEGPHIVALALLPFALAFAWRALEARRPAALAWGAIFAAAVVSHNFYGATALALFYPVLVWSLWITRRPAGLVFRALLLPLLAYGLTAFWLVPSYLRVTIRNLQYVSGSGNLWSIVLAAAVVAAFGAVSWRLAVRRTERAWAVFTAGAVLLFSLDVLGNFYFHFRVAGEPLRLLPELDLVCILGAVTVLRWVWNRPSRLARGAAAVIVAAAGLTTVPYLAHSRLLFPVTTDYRSRVEYRLSEWLWKNLPDARVAATGSVRFWFDAWHDLAQLGGGSEQGLWNQRVSNAHWELLLGPVAEPAILWMQCLGVDAVYVSSRGSQEVYHDARYPEKFAGVLPVLYDDDGGDVIYAVPRRWPVRARVVETSRLDALQTPEGNSDMPRLWAYADVIERGPDAPVILTREGTDAMRIQARVEPGQSIVVQESYDPAWQAWSQGRRLRLRPDAIGFMVIEASPGDQPILLRFATPLENQVGRVLTLLTILALLSLFASAVRARRDYQSVSNSR